MSIPQRNKDFKWHLLNTEVQTSGLANYIEAVGINMLKSLR